MTIIALLDTNVWVSALINPHGVPARIINAWRDERFLVVISDFLLREIVDVLSRPRIHDKYGIPYDDIAGYVNKIEAQAIKVSPTGDLKLCRDPRDDTILETAVLGRVGDVVSRDEDITRDLELRERLIEQGITPITVRAFSNLIEAAQPEE